MILGRNAGLWGGLVQSALNVAAAVVVVLTNTNLSAPDVALFAALNAFGLAVVAVLANSSDPTTAPTFALTTKAPGIRTASSSGVTASPPGMTPIATDATTAGPTTAGPSDGAMG